MPSYRISQRLKCRGNRNWYGRIREDDGSFRYISLRTTRREVAEDWLSRMNADRFVPAYLIAERKDCPLNKAVLSFLTSVESSKGKSSATMTAYVNRIKIFERWCESRGISSLRGISGDAASSFAAKIYEDGYAPKTRREVIRCVGQMLSWCAEAFGMGAFDPMKSVNLPKVPKREKKFWTPSEVDRILDSAPDREMRAFWSLMAFAGLRHSEACSFGPSSILPDGSIRVVGKGDKEAFLPVSERLASELAGIGRPVREGEFSSARFKNSDRSNDALRKAVSKAGLDPEGRSCHTFRHSFASNLIRAGVNVKAVQQLMRHEDAKVTMDTYSHLLGEDLKEAADAIK